MGHAFLAGIAVTALLAGSALAADMPLKAVAPAIAYDWSGFYIGGVVSGAWGTTDPPIRASAFSASSPMYR